MIKYKNRGSQVATLLSSLYLSALSVATLATANKVATGSQVAVSPYISNQKKVVKICEQ